jgi:glycosyltransferase involved in cell wall biosynthesis
MEARAAGLAIVTSDHGALRETVGEHGYLIPWAPDEMEPHNHSEVYGNTFVNKVVQALRDPDEWAIMHHAARAGFEENDWERRIDDWVELIERSHT